MEQSELSAYCHPRCQLARHRCSKTCCGYPASRARGEGSIAAQLVAGCHLSPTTSPPLPLFIMHSCIFTTPYSSETLQLLSCQHIFFTHLLSKHTGDPTYLSFYACVGYSVFMWRRAESIWALQLHQQRVTANKTSLILLLTEIESITR